MLNIPACVKTGTNLQLKIIKNRIMEALKYTVIKSVEQYKEYCNNLEKILENDNEAAADEIDLLTLLIEKWDEENTSFNQLTPIELLKSLMEENNLKAVDLVDILGLSKGTVSKILNYQKGLSKDTIRKLSAHFSMNQEAFNRPYKLNNKMNRRFKNESLMNYKKKMKAKQKQLLVEIMKADEKSGLYDS